LGPQIASRSALAGIDAAGAWLRVTGTSAPPAGAPSELAFIASAAATSGDPAAYDYVASTTVLSTNCSGDFE